MENNLWDTLTELSVNDETVEKLGKKKNKRTFYLVNVKVCKSNRLCR